MYDERDDDTMPQKVARMAMMQVHILDYQEAQYVTRVLADTSKKQMTTGHYALAPESVRAIIEEGARDEMAKAAAKEELDIAKHGKGMDGNARLKPAVTTLRKRPSLCVRIHVL